MHWIDVKTEDGVKRLRVKIEDISLIGRTLHNGKKFKEYFIHVDGEDYEISLVSYLLLLAQTHCVVRGKHTMINDE